MRPQPLFGKPFEKRQMIRLVFVDRLQRQLELDAGDAVPRGPDAVEEPILIALGVRFHEDAVLGRRVRCASHST